MASKKPVARLAGFRRAEVALHRSVARRSRRRRLGRSRRTDGVLFRRLRRRHLEDRGRRRVLALRVGRLHGQRGGRLHRRGALGSQRDLCRHRRDRDPPRRVLRRRHVQVDRRRPHLEQHRPEEQQVHRPHLHPSARIPTSSMSRRWATSSVPTRSAASIARRTAARAGRRSCYRSDVAGAIDLSMDRTNPRILFASIWEARRNFWNISSGGPGSGLFRSTDGGDTWEEISRKPGLPDGLLGKIGVSISPARAGRVWALIEAEGDKTGLYRSDDYGVRWTHGVAQPRPDAPALVLHPRLRRPRPRRHGLRHQPADVEVDRRRRELQRGHDAARRQPRPLDRPQRPQPHDRGQRRRRQRLVQRRRLVVDDLQPEDRAVLSHRRRQPVSLPRLRHAAGQHLDLGAERLGVGRHHAGRLLLSRHRRDRASSPSIRATTTSSMSAPSARARAAPARCSATTIARARSSWSTCGRRNRPASRPRT